MSMNRVRGWFAVGVLVGSVVPLAGQQPDALDEALAEVGLQRRDLGWSPKGWWSRFPADVPYKLRAFDALFAEPLDTVAYARSLANAATTHLAPDAMDERLERGTTHLAQAVHRLGINPKFGGLRGYTANLVAEDTPLDEAILRIHHEADRPTYAYTFAMELPYPKPEKELARCIEEVPVAVRPILGKLIVNITDAHRWARLAFRNVPAEKRMVVSRRFNLGEEQVDAFDYCPEVDDVARTWDEASLWYAAEKCVQALDDARIALLGVSDIPPFAFDWETPWGWIRIRGSGDDSVDGTDALLIVDLGGNDVYTGAVASSNAHRPVGLLLDCTGDDRYDAGGGDATTPVPAQGAGLCGVGILLDGGGRDTYHAARYAQGVGQFGFGLCADISGNDEYFVEYSGQGCGYFGVGLLLDNTGEDRYKLYADGQGLGGVAGVGVLADRSGSDSYEAVRDAKVTGRPSYHSPDEDISVNNAQGCAMGRRGDGADGHSWAGGLGALLDSEGDDRYLSGNWTMGTGYWFGMGLLHDGAGNDTYNGVCYSQATGAHFCIGVLIDEGGNDIHKAEVTSNMSIGWGHDFVISLLVNVGGDDIYNVKGNGMSYSINRSVTALIDVGGNDRYIGAQNHHPAMAEFADRFRARGGVSDYFADTTSLALFVDVGGTDLYMTQPMDNVKSNEDSDEAGCDPPVAFGGANDTTWADEPESDNTRERNFRVGVDRANGVVHFRPRPMKTPSGAKR